MADFLFYIFAALTLLSGLMVVISRNPVNSAMFMIVAFVSTAFLFGLLQAFFLAGLQILVYAGAVIVLFLFIIMLLDVEASKVRPRTLSLAASIVGLALLVLGVFAVVGGDFATHEALVEAPATSPKIFGYELFSRYLLPFQLTGFLLLIAMIGVIVLSKKRSETQAA